MNVICSFPFSSSIPVPILATILFQPKSKFPVIGTEPSAKKSQLPEGVCHEQVPSQSSLRYLVPPASQVDSTAVPSGVPQAAAWNVGAAPVPLLVRTWLAVPTATTAGAPAASHVISSQSVPLANIATSTAQAAIVVAIEPDDVTSPVSVNAAHTLVASVTSAAVSIQSNLVLSQSAKAHSEGLSWYAVKLWSQVLVPEVLLSIVLSADVSILASAASAKLDIRKASPATVVGS